MNKSCDLLVIGGGSAGVRMARWSAGLGAKVIIAEGDRWGGTCVIKGCVPKKLMAHAAHFQHDMQHAVDYGLLASLPVIDNDSFWPRFKMKRDAEVQRLSAIYQKLLDDKKIERLSGMAKFLDAQRVQVGDAIVTAKKIVIATGGTATALTIPGGEHVDYSDQVFEWTRLPKSCVVIGSGFIALEMASILAAFGVQIDVLVRGDVILREWDFQATKFLGEQLQDHKVRLHYMTSASHIEKKGELLQVHTNNGIFSTEKILVAIGRLPNTKTLDLEKAHIEEKKGAIIVNDRFQTSQEHIYALGDCLGGEMLTPVATAQATWLSEFLYGGKSNLPHFANRLLPKAVFTYPEIAAIGITEQEVGIDNVDVYETQFRSLKITLTNSKDRVLQKLFVCGNTRKILGAVMVGEQAAEMMQLLAVAMQSGATKEHFDATIGIHPTIAEEWVTLRSSRRVL